ncbi:MAG TPA: FtsX-like permease family protein, partial [Longimicrobiales bacterium]|nr:FtsX-like permease family protein [Longimicrobiales bacterium]
SPGRLLRQLLAEGLLYGSLAGTAAAGLARAAVAALGAIVPSAVTYFSPYAFQVEGRTLLFVFGLSFLVGTILGLIPGVQALRLRRAPLSARRGREDSPAGRRARNALVTAQVALSMALLVAAGLMVKGFARLLAVDAGFDIDRVALASVGLSPTRYPDGAARAELLRRLTDALEAHPAIEAVSLGSGAGWGPGQALEAEGEPPPADRPSRVPRASVGPDFFETMGIDVVDGRALNAADAATGNVVVDRDLARLLWGSRSPVGRRFRTGADGEWWTVVGVVAELRLLGRDQRDGPYQFLTAMDPDRVGRQYVQLAMRTSGPPEALLPVFRRTLRTLDPQQWIWKLSTASDSLAEEEEKPRFLVTLMSLLAGVAVSLSAVGLYGVLAHSVGRRNREIGVRVALGADRGRVRGMVLGEGLRVAALGVTLGIGGAALASRLVAQLLYEVEPGDPATLAAASALFLLVAAAASLMPAVRATRVDPVRVLQAD